MLLLIERSFLWGCSSSSLIRSLNRSISLKMVSRSNHVLSLRLRDRYLNAWGSDRTSSVDLLLHCPPLFWQLKQGTLLSHLMRCTRHQSQALATCLRFDRTGVDGERGGAPAKVVNMMMLTRRCEKYSRRYSILLLEPYLGPLRRYGLLRGVDFYTGRREAPWCSLVDSKQR